MSRPPCDCVMCGRFSPKGLLLHRACEQRLLHRQHGQADRHQMVLALQMKQRLGQIDGHIDDDWMSRRTGEELRTLYLWLFGPNDTPEFFRSYLTQEAKAV